DYYNSWRRRYRACGFRYDGDAITPVSREGVGPPSVILEAVVAFGASPEPLAILSFVNPTDATPRLEVTWAVSAGHELAPAEVGLPDANDTPAYRKGIWLTDGTLYAQPVRTTISADASFVRYSASLWFDGRSQAAAAALSLDAHFGFVPLNPRELAHRSKQLANHAWPRQWYDKETATWWLPNSVLVPA
ncbi:MAG: hypothetical protein KGK12_03870, partial [Armatimonadetes bacterium]|nr:hypothetical protein [Armatimonadota bacterium]